MLEHAKKRTAEFQQRLRDAGVELAVLSDESSIAYLAGFWGYLGIEFGRPTFLIVRPDGAPSVVTPLMESEMVSAMTWVDDVRTWKDFGQRSWARVLGEAIGDSPKSIWIEKNFIPAVARNFLDERYPGVPLEDVSPLLAAQRMVKAPEEIDVMRAAGQIARDLGLVDPGYRMLANHGRDGRQEVAHFHLHIFGGQDCGRMITPAGK